MWYLLLMLTFKKITLIVLVCLALQIKYADLSQHLKKIKVLLNVKVKFLLKANMNFSAEDELLK